MDYIVSQKGFWEEDDESVLKAIREGYLQTHYAMWKDLGKAILYLFYIVLLSTYQRRLPSDSLCNVERFR